MKFLQIVFQSSDCQVITSWVYEDPLEVGYITVYSFQDILSALPLIIPREFGAFNFEIM